MELYRRGYHTVEATFLMLIITVVIVMLCMLSLYIHDETVMDAEIRYELAVWANHNYSSENIETQIKKDLEKRLFIVDIDEVKAEEGLAEIEATVNYRSNIKLFGIDKVKETSQSRYDIKPSHILWDLSVIKD